MLIIFVIFGSHVVFAQPSGGELNIGAIQTPTAAAFGEYVEMPVSHFTGIPQIAIPLHTLKEGDLQLPIYLSYHASGLRVANPSSWTGMGWTLNSGGMIMRSRRGGYDDDSTKKGYYYHGQVVHDGTLEIDILAYERGEVDFEPDIFSFNFLGKSGKFYFDGTSEKRIVLLPDNDLIIEPLFQREFGTIKGFVITGPDGTKYYFGVPSDEITSDEVPKMERTGMNLDYYSPRRDLSPCGDSWFLVKIESADGNYSIDFNYEKEKYKYLTNSDQRGVSNKASILNPDGSETGCYRRTDFNLDYLTPGNIGDLENKPISINYIESYRLVGIETKSGTESVFLSAEENRQDLSIWNNFDGSSQPPKRLNNIEFRQNKQGDFYGLCKQVAFEYSYVTGPATDDVENDSSLKGPHDPTSSYRKRLKLESIQEQQCGTFGERTKVPSHIFEYYEGAPYPSLLSKAIDHWGFYNNVTSNDARSGLLPRVVPYINSGLNRNVGNLNSALTGTLKKQILPTGGEISYVYERHKAENSGNDFWINDLVGGLRIKEITASTNQIAGNSTVSRSFKYQKPNGTKSGVLFKYPNYKIDYNVVSSPGSSSLLIEATDIRSNFYTSHTDFDGRHICYSHVEEIIPNSGSIIREYYMGAMPNGSPPEDQLPLPTLPDFARGQLKEEKSFNESGQLIARKSIDGIEVVYPGIDNAGAVLSLFTVSESGSVCNGVIIPPRILLGPRGYGIKNGFFKVNSKVNEIDGVASTTSYNYESDVYPTYPTSISTENSDGKTYLKRYAYPDASTDSAALKLKELNIISTLESSLEVNSIMVSGQQSIFSLDAGFPRLSRVNKYIATESDDAVWSGSWEEEVRIENYKYGRPQFVTYKGWDTIIFDWYPTGLVKSKQFLDFKEEYTYVTNSNFLLQHINVDSSKIRYKYDELTRLDSVTVLSPNGGIEIKKDISYGYHRSGVGNRVTITDQYELTEDVAELCDFTAQSVSQYYDGLGRPSQQVDRWKINDQQDPESFKSLIQNAIEYDEVGRPYKRYEAFPSDSDSRAYVDPTGNDYTLVEYFADPLGRVQYTTMPQWSRKQYQHGSNIDIIETPLNDVYPVNSLFVTRLIDEEGKISETFADIRGRIILQRRHKGADDFVDTYSTYDLKDRLKFVFPAGASSASNNLFYGYTYDGWNNLLSKKFPDRPIENYYYNQRDLLTYTEGELYPSGLGYYSNVYDGYGRITKTGFTNTINAENESREQDITNGSTTSLFQYGNTNFLKDKVISSSTFKMDGRNVANHSYTTLYEYDTFGKLISKKSNHPLNDDQNSRIEKFVTHPNGMVLSSSNAVHTDKRYHRSWNSSSVNRSGRVVSQSHRLIDGILVGAIDTIAEYDYNSKGELSTKFLGGKKQTLQRVDYTYLPNGFLNSINDVTAREDDLFGLKLHYSNGEITHSNGNILKLDQFGSGVSNLVQDFIYDNLDRLNLHETKIDGIDYTGSINYDDRGNISSLSRAGVLEDGSNNWVDLLEYTIHQNSNKVASISDGTGNQGDSGFNNSTSGLDYVYDENGNVTVDPTNSIIVDYNYLNLPYRFEKSNGTTVDIIYTSTGEKIGEITSSIDGQSTVRTYIGDMVFKENRLDYALHAEGRVASSGFYSYGLLRDCNEDKDIPDIPDFPEIEEDDLNIYNNLGAYENFLPQDRSVYRGRKTLATASVPITNPTAITAEKTIELKSGFSSQLGTTFAAFTASCPQSVDWISEYNLTDQLGNVRVRFADWDLNGSIEEEEVISEHHYYPFGMEMRGAWNDSQTGVDDNRYRYNGKELNEDLGLYAYGFRYYDPAIGRFTGVDPISDQFPHVSTYNYAENEPIANIDLHGLQKVRADDVRDSNGNVGRRNVSASYNQKVINLSSKQGHEISVGLGRVKSSIESSFSGRAPSYVRTDDYQLTDRKVTVSVKTRVNQTVVTSLDDVSDTDFLMIVVDQVVNSNEENVQGWGETPGNVTLVEAGELTGEKGGELGAHEFGHNTGADHSSDGSGLMGDHLNGSISLTRQQILKFIQDLGGTKTPKEFANGRRHKTHYRTRSRARDFLNSHGEKYDRKKAKDAGF
ncbi:hypothetical protein A3850_003735 [Lewinella sp. 4G2]|nr:hypothetical protein A3850_003735 [Lewinella sp. 4G2]